MHSGDSGSYFAAVQPGWTELDGGVDVSRAQMREDPGASAAHLYEPGAKYGRPMYTIGLDTIDPRWLMPPNAVDMNMCTGWATRAGLLAGDLMHSCTSSRPAGNTTSASPAAGSSRPTSLTGE